MKKNTVLKATKIQPNKTIWEKSEDYQRKPENIGDKTRQSAEEDKSAKMDGTAQSQQRGIYEIGSPRLARSSGPVCIPLAVNEWYRFFFFKTKRVLKYLKKKERKKNITRELKLNLKLCIYWYVSTLNVYLKVIKTLIIRTDQDSRIKGCQGHNKKFFVFTSLHNNHSAQRSSKESHLVWKKYKQI